MMSGGRPDRFSHLLGAPHVILPSVPDTDSKLTWSSQTDLKACHRIALIDLLKGRGMAEVPTFSSLSDVYGEDGESRPDPA